LKGIRPAISVGLSVSRVGSAAQTKAMKKVSGKTKLQLAQFREKEAFAQFGSDLDESTKALLEKGNRIVELFKQTLSDPKALEVQVAVLFAMENGYFDDVPVDKIKDCQAKMEEFLTTRKEAVMAKVLQEKALTDEVTSDLKSAIEDFKSSYSA
jgi:F-type H+-transporting ATPase subunit alpha